MPEIVKLGIVGLDTSHVGAFTKILNDESDPHYIPGATVVAAYPSFSPDLPSSADRVEGYTQELREKYGVEMVASISELCGKVDAVLLHSVDGRRHLAEYRQVAEGGKPCFVDKPFTTSLADARAIRDLAAQKGLPVFSSSSLRFVTEIQDILAKPDELGEIEQVHVFAPAHLEPTNPGLYWYGVHGVEMIYTLLGPGCAEVTSLSSDKGDLVLGVWKNGRRASLAATRLAQGDYGAVVHGTKGTRAFVCNLADLYVPLIKSTVAFFKGAKAPVSVDTTVEMMGFIESALHSEGKPVPVEG